ncbi:MAG: DUF1566 domain-containing protein [Spirochaetaceae bacterium]|nr:MAG: DUF1566 domain-containing protein [Spirochaetaceae bacterium]
MKFSTQNRETHFTSGQAISRPALFLALLTAVLTLGSCVWGMNAEEQSGRISISVGGSGGIGAMDLSVFDRVTFFVATADSFRRVDPVISFREDDSAQREIALDNFSEFQTATAVTFSIGEVIAALGQLVQIPGGQAVSYSGAALPEVVSFENLDTDRDFLVWIDATENVDSGSPRLGYAVVRVRAGVDTRVTVTIPADDGFQEFLEFVYSSYIVPITPFAIGDIGPAGGLVFYVDEAGDFPWTYLEAAPAGWSGDPEDPQLSWENITSTDVPDAEQAAIGTGAANTTAIIAALGPERGFAAHAAGELDLNGFDDWFLPSLDELNMLYLNLQDQVVPLGGLSAVRYWSSTQHAQSIARYLNFADGTSALGSKPSQHRVRPVRRF